LSPPNLTFTKFCAILAAISHFKPNAPPSQIPPPLFRRRKFKKLQKDVGTLEKYLCLPGISIKNINLTNVSFVNFYKRTGENCPRGVAGF
jgi:hypothetical protein